MGCKLLPQGITLAISACFGIDPCDCLVTGLPSNSQGIHPAVVKNKIISLVVKNKIISLIVYDLYILIQTPYELTTANAEQLGGSWSTQFSIRLYLIPALSKLFRRTVWW